MLLYYLIVILPVMAVLSLLVYLPFYLVGRRRWGKRPLIRHLVLYALIGAVLSLLYLTIFIDGLALDFSPGYHLLNLIPFNWIWTPYTMGAAHMARQLLLNVLMLVPLGILLPMAFPRLRKGCRTVLCIFLLIVGIETLQYFIGRSCDVDDLIMNTAGGLIGWGAFAGANRLWKDKPWWQNALGQQSK
ncbi:MAG: VanZ family protein [Candidatus Onthomonas sp.]